MLRAIALTCSLPIAAGERLLSSQAFIELAEQSGCHEHWAPYAQVGFDGDILELASTASHSCRRCASSAPTCKFCPLSATCEPTGLWGNGCPRRPALPGARLDPSEDGEHPYTEDRKIKGERDVERCDGALPWVAVLEQALGVGWARDFVAREGFEVTGRELGGGGLAAPASMTVREAEAACLAMPGCAGFDAPRGEGSGRLRPRFVGRGRLRPKGGSQAHVPGSQRHSDAARCVQWSLGWPVPALRAGDQEDGSSAEERGTQGCISALFRRAVLQMLGRAANGTSDTAEGWPEGQPDSGWSGDRAWTPRLCELIAVRFPGWDCRVTVHGGDDFGTHLGARLTETIATSLHMGPIKFFNPGAGLSGSSFAQTADGIFKVKMGLRQSRFGTVDEVQSLQHVILGNDGTGAPSLKEHFSAFPSSTLNRVYGLVQLDFGGLGLRGSTNLVILEDAGYGVAGAAAPGTVQRYDLKGASRDQDRTSSPGAFTRQNGDFALHEGLVDLDVASCTRLHRHMEADMGFLDVHGLIDYSVFLTVFEHPSPDVRRLCVELGEPKCWQGVSKVYAVSIIDYLNDYALSKRLESLASAAVGRGYKFHRYAAQMLHYLAQICPVPAEIQAELVEME